MAVRLNASVITRSSAISSNWNRLQVRNVNNFAKFQTDTFPNVIKTNNVPIHLYTNEVEEKAMDQVYALANSDIPVGYVSIMPDVHWGKGSVVGAVFGCRDKICPMAVVCNS